MVATHGQEIDTSESENWIPILFYSVHVNDGAKIFLFISLPNSNKCFGNVKSRYIQTLYIKYALGKWCLKYNFYASKLKLYCQSGTLPAYLSKGWIKKM